MRGWDADESGRGGIAAPAERRGSRCAKVQDLPLLHVGRRPEEQLGCGWWGVRRMPRASVRTSYPETRLDGGTRTVMFAAMPDPRRQSWEDAQAVVSAAGGEQES